MYIRGVGCVCVCVEGLLEVDEVLGSKEHQSFHCLTKTISITKADFVLNGLSDRAVRWLTAEPALR